MLADNKSTVQLQYIYHILIILLKPFKSNMSCIYITVVILIPTTGQLSTPVYNSLNV